MAFPTAPTNGQTATVNGILYAYNSTTNSWKRQLLSNLSVTGISGTSITVTGNATVANLNLTGNIVDTGALSIITGASGNVTLAPNGTSVLVTTTTGANVTGTFNATGNITGNVFLGNGSQLTGIATGASNARAVGFSLVFGG